MTMSLGTSARPILFTALIAAATALGAERSGSTSSTSPSSKGTPTDAAIREILRDRIENAKRGVGIVVGIVDESGRRVIPYGVTDTTSGREVDGDTLFEIGSITKTFTATLLADMVLHGELKLDDPVSDYLPSSVRRLRSGGKDVSLLQLATHTSGLPFMDSTFRPANPMNRYAGYTADRMYAFLATFDHPGVPADQPYYSNLGFGLLGVALANRMHTDYPTLLRDRILEPLGMRHTAIVLTPDEEAHYATPHSRALEPVLPLDIGALDAAGAIRSSMNDMLSYAEAYLGLKASPLAAAMKLAGEARNQAGNQALAWIVRYNGDELWHNGGTNGFTSVMYLDMRNRRAVVLLANARHDHADIAYHIVHPDVPTLKLEPDKQHSAIKLSNPKAFDAYVGRYEMGPDFYVDFMREGDRYFTQGKGQDKIEILPYSESAFFLVDMPVHVQFTRDAKGVVTGVVVHQNGDDVYGRGGNKVR
jgi:serine-type D-Ala-D-Ala carboxypeptidase/endopeptidase